MHFLCQAASACADSLPLLCHIERQSGVIAVLRKERTALCFVGIFYFAYYYLLWEYYMQRDSYYTRTHIR